ncbi:MAG: hypothetical protein MK138_14075, partial [Planctomycetes bacterium]|nr:hypothetical protein [Planctomycetota bacterium]
LAAAMDAIVEQARGGHDSDLGSPTLEGEDALGPSLDEEDQDAQHEDLSQDSAGDRLEKLVDDSEAQRGESHYADDSP